MLTVLAYVGLIILGCLITFVWIHLNSYRESAEVKKLPMDAHAELERAKQMRSELSKSRMELRSYCITPPSDKEGTNG